MKQNVSPGVAIAIIVIAIILAIFFGYRYISGGPNADVTQENLKHWQQLRQHPPTQTAQPGRPGTGTSAGQ
ncbi:hypothetical protein CWRG_02619 [Chthonomonas calidirosea]|uniref:hypothetical protein n=1 Tax=Chthonomonas calidirosea TaxID=454171 RepID=UPI0006DD47F6|nr:hypothetical protein [Chthonomonas calidirosea]CEK19790.1 hypothetical protein CWRG_02619 [Chthonomonas calidirosea]CEK19795.1 hypothetical protein CP488_02641 [Chthonomonas calidirosea]